jgi:hypothetical protein
MNVQDRQTYDQLINFTSTSSTYAAARLPTELHFNTLHTNAVASTAKHARQALIHWTTDFAPPY